MKVLRDEDSGLFYINHWDPVHAVTMTFLYSVCLLLMVIVAVVFVRIMGVGLFEIVFFAFFYCIIFAVLALMTCGVHFRWGVVLDRRKGTVTIWWRLFTRVKQAHVDMRSVEKVVVRKEVYWTTAQVRPSDWQPTVRSTCAKLVMRGRGIGKFYPVTLEGSGDPVELYAPRRVEQARELAAQVGRFLGVTVSDET